MRGIINYCVSEVQLWLLVNKKIEKKLALVKARLTLNPFLSTKHCKYGRQSSLLVGYTIQPSSSSTNQNIALIIDH